MAIRRPSPRYLFLSSKKKKKKKELSSPGFMELGEWVVGEGVIDPGSAI